MTMPLILLDMEGVSIIALVAMRGANCVNTQPPVGQRMRLTTCLSVGPSDDRKSPVPFLPHGLEPPVLKRCLSTKDAVSVAAESARSVAVCDSLARAKALIAKCLDALEAVHDCVDEFCDEDRGGSDMEPESPDASGDDE